MNSKHDRKTQTGLAQTCDGMGGADCAPLFGFICARVFPAELEQSRTRFAFPFL